MDRSQHQGRGGNSLQGVAVWSRKAVRCEIGVSGSLQLEAEQGEKENETGRQKSMSGSHFDLEFAVDDFICQLYSLGTDAD